MSTRLLPEKELKVLLYLNTKKVAHWTEVSKATGIPPSSTRVYLSRLKKKGLVDVKGRVWYITELGEKVASRVLEEAIEKTVEEEKGERQ